MISESELGNDWTILALWPCFNYRAGPAEVLFQASSRANACVTHFMVDFTGPSALANI